MGERSIHYVSEQHLSQMVRERVAKERALLAELQATSHEQIGDHYKLKIDTSSSHSNHDGMLIGDIVLLNKFDRGPERINFTFFHEITHHIVSTDEELLSLIHEMPCSPKELDKLIERLCNIGAAEFLVPSDAVRECFKEHGFSASVIRILSEQRVASGQVVAFQMIHCAQHECYLVIAQPRSPIHNGSQLSYANTDLAPTEQLHIVHSAKSASARYSVARGTLIPKTHLLAEVFAKQTHITAVANIPFASGTNWEVNCDALYFRQSVYAFFNVNNPADPQQPLLF